MNSPLVYMCITSMILSLMLLWFNKGYKSANRFLAGVLFFSSLFFFTIFVFIFNQNLTIIAICETVLPSFYFLIGPFSYFYIRSILKDNARLCKYDYLHILLFGLAFAGTMPLLFSSWVHKLQIAENIRSNFWFHPSYRINTFFSPDLNKILKAIQISVYVIMNWLMLYKYKQELKQRILHTNQYYIIRNWLLIFCSFLSFAAVFISLGVYNVVTLLKKDLFLQYYYNPLLLLSFSFLMLNLALLFFPQILYGLPVERIGGTDNDAPQDSFEQEDNHLHQPETPETEEKRTPSFYSTDYLAQIELSIKKVQDNDLFLDPNFNMEQISDSSAIPLHHLAYYFSKIHPIKFVEWRNSLRVQHSIKLIEEGSLDFHSFEGVAIKCGFSSRHTFMRAFKSITGKTPGEYFKPK